MNQVDCFFRRRRFVFWEVDLLNFLVESQQTIP